MIFDARSAVWVAAVFSLIVAPLALLFGVEFWRVGIVIIFELAMVFWTARWAKQR